MDTDAHLGLRLGDREHQNLMKSIAKKMSDTPYVLKGGTALLFARGLDRHSTDLDFDAPKALNLEKIIKESFKEQGIEITSFSLRKNTEKKQRYMVHYNNPKSEIDTLLKIETGIGIKPDKKSLEIVNGIKTYKLSEAFDQKLKAFGDRDSVRDIYDINFMLKNHAKDLSDKQIYAADAAFKDIDSISASYHLDHDRDIILGEQSLDVMILETRSNIDEIKKERGLSQSGIKNNDIVTIEEAISKIKNPLRQKQAQNQYEQMQGRGKITNLRPKANAKQPPKKSRDFGIDD